VGRLHPAHRGVDEDTPYVLRGLENGKTQLERLTGGPVLKPHPRQTFEPLILIEASKTKNVKREFQAYLEDAARRSESAGIQPSRPPVFLGEGFLSNSFEGRTAPQNSFVCIQLADSRLIGSANFSFQCDSKISKGR